MQNYQISSFALKKKEKKRQIQDVYKRTILFAKKITNFTSFYSVDNTQQIIVQFHNQTSRTFCLTSVLNSHAICHMLWCLDLVFHVGSQTNTMSKWTFMWISLNYICVPVHLCCSDVVLCSRTVLCDAQLYLRCFVVHWLLTGVPFHFVRVHLWKYKSTFWCIQLMCVTYI